MPARILASKAREYADLWSKMVMRMDPDTRADALAMAAAAPVPVEQFATKPESAPEVATDASE